MTDRMLIDLHSMLMDLFSGVSTPAEAEQNVALMDVKVPMDLWRGFKEVRFLLKSCEVHTKPDFTLKLMDCVQSGGPARRRCADRRADSPSLTVKAAREGCT